MRIYLFVYFLLILVYASSLKASDKPQHIVESAVEAPVFMSLDKYRANSPMKIGSTQFFPLKPRQGGLPLQRKTASVPGQQVTAPRVDNRDGNKPQPLPAQRSTSSIMSSEQAQQILSIYGNGR